MKRKIINSRPRLSRALQGLSTLLTAVVLVTITSALLLSWGGLKTFYVVSGSMEPIFYKNDLVLVSTKANNMEVGDVVAYRATWANQEIVTHRIVYRKGDKIVVKGDNNPNPDPAFDKSALYGEVVGIFPKAGFVANAFTLITFSLLSMIFFFLGDAYKPRPRRAWE